MWETVTTSWGGGSVCGRSNLDTFDRAMDKVFGKRVARPTSLSSRPLAPAPAKFVDVLGFASVTHVPYEVAPGESECIIAGAFKDSLLTSGPPPVKLHHTHQLKTGTVWAREVPLVGPHTALLCYMQISTEGMGQSVISRLRCGALAGMSIERGARYPDSIGAIKRHWRVDVGELTLTDRGRNHCAMAILCDDPPRECPTLPGPALNAKQQAERRDTFAKLLEWNRRISAPN